MEVKQGESREMEEKNGFAGKYLGVLVFISVADYCRGYGDGPATPVP